jgi:hypothetical protein
LILFSLYGMNSIIHNAYDKGRWDGGTEP